MLFGPTLATGEFQLKGIVLDQITDSTYSNANYNLSETKNPVRTLKFAAPLALGSVSVLYMLVNVSSFYFK
jgi:hypothetical protein